MRKSLTLVLIMLGMGLTAIVGASTPATKPVPPATTRGVGPVATTRGTGGAAGKELILDLGDKVTLKLVQIPAGKFLMGSPATEQDREDNEVQHEVTISKPFFMGMTHVTVDQFAAFAKDSGYKTDAEKDGYSNVSEIKDGKLNPVPRLAGCSWHNPGYDQKGNHPVVQVSRNDAQAFCGWLSKKSGESVTLPTEEQWEYACRAGTKTAYPWGDNPNDGKGWANCADQSFQKKLPNQTGWSYFGWDDGFVFTSPVASFKPNAFGLYDMNGNAYQWCQNPRDPTGVVAGSSPVLRGGSWMSPPRYCRSSYRDKFGPSMRNQDFGFRVAMVAVGGDVK